MIAPTAPETAEEWEALLYDWHNQHRLRRQQRDIAYWLNLTERNDRLLVLGAGTGRVAVPLAEHRDSNHDRDRSVTAVDLSQARLRRMP
ncbi:hypothetical protein ACFU99_20285, partial [Streptomyces sp. NPDC057654]|uniref:hypothetical protein n=1 Tax=Streptomyces sp. NPDC057654 TaxID=3346196 RepID=UPI00368640DB